MKSWHVIKDAEGMYYAGGHQWVEDVNEAATFYGDDVANEMIQVVCETHEGLSELTTVAIDEIIQRAPAA